MALAFGDGLHYFVLVFNGSGLSAVAGRDKDATQVWLSEAKALLTEGYGGSSKLAEKLLREEGTAGRLPWGYLRKNGDAADDEFWRYARLDFKENSARVGITLFFVGGGVAPTDVSRTTEYLGIWVSRAHLLALLPEPTDAEVPAPSASAQWAIAATRRLKTEGKIPEGMKKAKLAHLLEAEAEKDVRAGKLRRALKASYLENELANWGVWPLDSFR